MSKEEDFEWLRELEKRSWAEHPGDSLPPRKLGWREDLSVTKEDGEKALELFKKYRSDLLFEPGSGVLGFGVCITAYELVYPTYPGVPMELKRIITLTSKQLFPGLRGQVMELIYAIFASFTHTKENKELRKEAGISEPLKEYWHYDY